MRHLSLNSAWANHRCNQRGRPCHNQIVLSFFSMQVSFSFVAMSPTVRHLCPLLLVLIIHALCSSEKPTMRGARLCSVRNFSFSASSFSKARFHAFPGWSSSCVSVLSYLSLLMQRPMGLIKLYKHRGIRPEIGIQHYQFHVKR